MINLKYPWGNTNLNNKSYEWSYIKDKIPYFDSY